MPTETTLLPTSGMTGEEKRAAASAALDAFLASGDIEAWVRSRRDLYRFSLRNQILLLMQAHARGEDFRTDGIRAAWRWKKAGYHPAKGQSALWVWAYRSRRRKDGTWHHCGATLRKGECPECGIPDHYFTPAPEFSPSQVVSFEDGSPPPLPPDPQPLEGDSHAGCLPRLEAWALEQDGIEHVLFDARDVGGAQGYWSPTDQAIWVSTDQAPNAQVKTLIHELAHAHGGIDYESYSRGEAELIVEAAAYLACAALGLDTGDYSLAYVASWGGHDGEDPKAALLRHLTVIDTLARTLEKAAREPEQEDKEA